ncbi:MAG: hypothetical protein GY928_06010 [Colwellia sp.]|nr:hypothetical protein [Colwellia sp.]
MNNNEIKLRGLLLLKLRIGLKCAQSRSTKRFDNLLLIAALILFVLWCLGYAATLKKYNYTRYHSKCLISVGAKNDLGKAFILYNGHSIV